MKLAKFSTFELVPPIKIDFFPEKKIKSFLCIKFNGDSENIIRLVLRWYLKMGQYDS